MKKVLPCDILLLAIFPVLALVETAALWLTNPNYAQSNTISDSSKGKTTNAKLKKLTERIIQESRGYATSALTLAGLAFAALALSQSQTGYSLEHHFVALAAEATILFILSYQMNGFAAKKQIHFSAQSVLLNCGLLSLVFAVVLLAIQILPSISVILLFGMIAVIVLHFYEFYLDRNTYLNAS